MKILLFLGGGIGNIIQATPAIQSMISAGHIVDINLFPNYPEVQEIIKLPGVRNVFVEGSPKDVYDYQLSGPFLIPSKVKSKFQFDKKKHLVYQGNYKQARPESKIFNELISRIGIKPTCRQIKINIGSTGISPTHPNTIVLFPGSKKGWELKRWDKYDKLASKLSKLSHPVTVLGLESDFSQKWNWPPRTEFFSGSLIEVSYYISKCKMFIGNDSGLAHMAAAIGIPTFVIFGPTCPTKNRPLSPNAHVVSLGLKCQPCQWNIPCWKRLCNSLECPSELKCIRHLRVGDILKKIRGKT